MILLDELDYDWPKRTPDQYFTATEAVGNREYVRDEQGRFAGGGNNPDALVGVPADSVPPPPKIGRLPNLTPHERAAESQFAEAYEKDPDGIAAKYRAGVLATTKPGDPPTFETDSAKNMASVWKDADLNIQCQNRATLNTVLHGTANAIAKRAFLQQLDTLEKGDNVLVTNGGCGAGKGYALKNVPEALAAKTNSKAVWDSAGDQNSSENRWIQKELEKRGLNGTYVHVTADPIKHWADPDMGVVARASNPKDGRMVDATVFADSYVRGTRNMKEFVADNKDNPSAKFIFLDARGKNPVQVPSMPEPRLPSRTALASFATQAAQGAPPHIEAGATIGGRLWA